MPPVATALVQIAPLQLTPALTFGLMYYVRAHRLAEQGKPVPSWRQACFYSGLARDRADARLAARRHSTASCSSSHMAEHLLLADVGALLLVLGFTGPLLAPLLRTKALGWMRHMAHPVPAYGLWAVDLCFWHLVGPHTAAVKHDAIHAVQHMLFVGFGINMWMALFGPLPKPSWFGNLGKLLYIVAVRLTSTVLANVFIWSGDVFFKVYAAGERAHGISPHSDQVIAGSEMMVEGSILTLCLFCWLFLRSAREGEERQELLELAAAGGFALDERRAARAVAAGRGGELRQRIEEGSTAQRVTSMRMSLLSKLTQVANSKQGKELLEKAKTIANDPKTREKIDEARGKITEQVDAAKHKLAEKKAKDEESKAAEAAAGRGRAPKRRRQVPPRCPTSRRLTAATVPRPRRYRPAPPRRPARHPQRAPSSAAATSTGDVRNLAR